MPEATTPYKRDVGYTVKNGNAGSTFLNSFPECYIGADEAAMSLADLVTRYAAIATSLNAVFNASHTAGRAVKVTKINHPMYEASMLAEDTAGKVKKISYIATIKEINNHANVIKHSGSFVGVPNDVSTEEYEALVATALDNLYGFCSDGTTKRFVALVWLGEKTMTKE